MKYPILKGVLALLFLLGSQQLPAQTFVHPGVPLTTADLNRVKANLAVEPWKTAYASLTASSQSQLTYVVQGPFQEVGRTPDVNRGAYVSDMRAMYNLSLMWWFTGNTAYADKALGIINGYATTHTIWSGAESYLTTSDAITCLAQGSEILRTYPGWTPTINTNVKNYFANMIWPQSGLPSPLRSANQGAAQLAIGMAAAVFCDDTARFNQCLDAFRNDACGGLANSLPNGQVGDTGRDTGHAWGELMGLAWIAEIAWKQGVDLYGEQNNRLLAACEYYSRFNLGYSTPFIQAGTCYGLYTAIGGTPTMTASMEMHNLIHGAYVIRKGLSAPYTTEWRNARTENSNSFVYRNAGGTQPAGPSVAAAPAGIIAPPAATSLSSADIGSIGVAGSSSYSGGTWTINASGADIWGTSDSFRFTYQKLTGNGTIIARVASIENTNASAKAGVMIRESLTATSNSIANYVSPGGGTQTNVRGATELSHYSNFANHSAGTTPYWVKLERRGDIFKTWSSPDGVNWSPLKTAVIPMADTAYIGLCVTSHDNTTLNTSTFTNVAIDASAGLIGDGTYKLVNRNSGKVLNVKAYSTANSAPLEQWSSNTNLAQYWSLTALGGGKYRVINVGSSKAMDVSSGSTGENAPLILWPYSPSAANQQFTFTATSSGYNRITPVHSGKSVGVSGTNTALPNQVDQTTYTGATHQQWLFQTP